MTRRLSCAALLAAGALAGCAVGPDFQRPAAPTTTRYTAAASASASASASAPASAPAPEPTTASQVIVEGRDIPAEWWSVFRSPALDAALRRALAANPDLAAADAALRVAQENLRAQQGVDYPAVTAQYSATRQGVAQPIASPLASGGDTYTLHTAQLSVGYVIDVFGANRRQVEAAAAQAETARWQWEAARLTLASNIVQAVIQQASNRAQVAATRRMVTLSTEQLDLLERQHALGQIGTADVAAQEATLAQLEATLPPLEKQVVLQDDLLAVLEGQLPSEAQLPEIALEALPLPVALPLSLPSTLVTQRPDIRAAEAQWHAASALVGVATANRFPSFTLTAGGGGSALQVAKLFSAGSQFWGLGAEVTQSVFDAGTLRHRQGAAEAGLAQAAAQYRSTVLVGFQNVADTLHAIDADARTLAATTRAERAAERSLAIARAQHNAGSVGVLAVIGAEQLWQQATLARIQAEAARLVDTAALFQALGGGWWNRVEAADAGASPRPAP